ncbi:MAG: hypothetical protein AAFX99_06235 [Myxococcota bacterium]
MTPLPPLSPPSTHSFCWLLRSGRTTALVGLLMGAATSPLAYAQDPPQVQRLHRKAVPQPSASPQSTDGGDEGVAALQVRRITRVPREDDGGGVELRGSAMDTRTLPTGFNRPLKPGQAQAERDGAVAADPGQPEGDAMETATENDAEAASEETGQLIAVAIAAAQVSAASQGRVLARSAVKTPTLPKHFVFRAPVRNRKITSRYGMRHHPMDRKKKRRGRKRRKKMHKGIDYGAPKGTPILRPGPVK